MRMTTKDLIDETDLKTSEEIKQYIKGSSYYVYFLVDPFDKQIKYVGKGQGYRCLDHFKNIYKNTRNRKSSWLKKLAKKNKEPLYVIWEFYDDEDLAYQQEKNFIDSFGRKSYENKGTLLNMSNELGSPIVRYSQELFIQECDLIHKGKYDYSKVIYKSAHNYINVICPKHGSFTTEANSHKRGSGCPKCNKGGYPFKEVTTEQFVQDMYNLHKDKYDLAKVVYKGSGVKIEVRCNKCNSVFYHTPYRFKQGYGCKKCYYRDGRLRNE